ncbi:MAG: hypothetical protein H7Y22_00140 [Gemmatimonadaceae bacterium]|nr:hypothetical protein [Gloeobacterales cyanobacterium ES-bin-141]
MSTKGLAVIPGVQWSSAQREATSAFLAALGGPCRCLAAEAAPYSVGKVRQFLLSLPFAECGVIAFSAGVVGAAGALTPGWLAGTNLQIKVLVALDGWPVPLFKPFPVYRVSHDLFTHQTSPGRGQVSFYADPAVTHLELWSAPAHAQGWQVGSGTQRRTSALEFIRERLAEYGVWE